MNICKHKNIWYATKYTLGAENVYAPLYIIIECIIEDVARHKQLDGTAWNI